MCFVIPYFCHSLGFVCSRQLCNYMLSPYKRPRRMVIMHCLDSRQPDSFMMLRFAFALVALLAVTVVIAADGPAKLMVWRIEKFVPTPVDPSTFGTFYTGDSYIILDNRETPASRNVHFWTGSASSKDEMATAAMLARRLAAGWRTRSIRQEQGRESAEFRAIFNDNISYQEGGVDSGFLPTKRNT